MLRSQGQRARSHAPAAAAAALLLAALAPAHAADVSIGLNDSAIELGYTSAPIGDGLEFTAGAFHKREKGKSGDIVTLGLQLAQPAAPGVRAALGGKVYAALNDAHDTASLALGGQLDLTPPSLPMLHFGLQAWFAPGVTSFGASDGLRDFGASIGYEVIRNAQITVSYRSVRVDYERGASAEQDAVLVGLKLTF